MYKLLRYGGEADEERLDRPDFSSISINPVVKFRTQYALIDSGNPGNYW